MWIAWTAFGIVSAVVVVMLVVRARRPATPKRLRQPDIEGVDHGKLPEPGSDEIPHRSDGRLMPGSEEYRNRQGLTVRMVCSMECSRDATRQL
jgi:hypothetical protein